MESCQRNVMENLVGGKLKAYSLTASIRRVLAPFSLQKKHTDYANFFITSN